MPRYLTKEQKRQCIALRVEHNLSTPAIARQVKISNHSAYKILKDYPWQPTAKRATRGLAWTEFEISLLRQHYPVADLERVVAHFPGRTWLTISRKASELKIKRPAPATRNNKRAVLGMFRQLRVERERLGFTRSKVAARCGYHFNQILAWELGKAIPRVNYFIDWAQALGFEVVLRPSAQTLLAERPALADKSRLMGGR